MGGVFVVGVLGELVVIGVSGLFMGQDVQYGEQWKCGFDFVFDEINGSGGIYGWLFVIDFQDSCSDLCQVVVIVQKFVVDLCIVIEFGDFLSVILMVVLLIYQCG